MSDFYQIYFEARRVALKMLRDRGYKLPDELSNPLTEQEFEVMYEKGQIDIGGIVDHENRPTYIKFIKDTVPFNKTAEKATVFADIVKYFKSLGMSDDMNLLEALKDGEVRVIIIYNATQSGQLQNKYEEEYITHPYIEVHQVQNMAIDPTAHKYQPQWKLITNPEEIAKLLRKYDAKPLMFGTIAIDDPINRYYRGRAAENGQLANIYEVTRGGVNIYYRRVISRRMNL